MQRSWCWVRAAQPAGGIFGLRERGAEVYILNRSAAAAQEARPAGHARSIRRADLKKYAFDVIINATPVGMGNTRDTPLQEKEINARYVFDHDLRSGRDPSGLKLAKERGSTNHSGHRNVCSPGGAPVREIWTGKPAPQDDMMQVVTLALPQERANRAAMVAAKKK